MDDAIDGGVFVKYLGERGLVGYVDVVEVAHYIFTCDLLDTTKTFLAAVAEVVDDNHLVTCVQKFDDGVAPNEPC